jgi:hypothetical protein
VEGSVGYIARLEIILANRISRRGRSNSACTEPVGVESSKAGPFQGQQREICRWVDVSVNFVALGVHVSVT